MAVDVGRDEVAEVARWADGIEGIQQCIGGRFRRPERRRRAMEYLKGLLRPVERKNGWQLAERAWYATPYRVQRLLSGYGWDADLVRDDLKDYVSQSPKCEGCSPAWYGRTITPLNSCCPGLNGEDSTRLKPDVATTNDA